MTIWEYYKRKLAKEKIYEKYGGWGEFPFFGDTEKPSFQGPPTALSDYGDLIQDYEPQKAPRYTMDYVEPAIDDRTLYQLMQTSGRSRNYEEI